MLGRLFPGGNTLEVRVLIKTVPDLVVFMAVPAAGLANVFAFYTGDSRQCGERLRRRGLFWSSRRGLRRLRGGRLARQRRNAGHINEESERDGAI